MTDNELFATDSQVSFPDPLAVLEINLGFRGCSFPAAGEYRFQLFADGNLLCERKFRITKVGNLPNEEGEEPEEEEEGGEAGEAD